MLTGGRTTEPSTGHGGLHVYLEALRMTNLLKAGLGLLAVLAVLIYVPGGWMLVLVLAAVALVMGLFLGYVWLLEVRPADRGPATAQDVLRERLRHRLGLQEGFR